MDNRIANDMISSGMIPSGEKNKEDLSRTQYGSVPSPSKLMDAYKSMYEHHQKDKDGNTIPHEGEELKEENINELKTRTMLDYIDKASDSASKELGKAEKTTSRKKEVKARLKMDKRERGIEMAKDKIMKRVKEDKKDMKEENINEALPVVPLAIKGLMAFKKAKFMSSALKSASAFKKGLMTKKAANVTGNVIGGANKISKAQKLGSGVRSAGAAMKNNPTNTALVGTMAMPRGGGGSAPQPAAVQQTKLGRRTAGMYNDVDLFDIVKGQLLDEGLTENEVLDVMTTLTIDEINEVINVEESLAKLALKTGAVVAGGVLAKKGLEKAKQSVDNQINKARDKGIGGNTRPGADKMYFGK